MPRNLLPLLLRNGFGALEAALADYKEVLGMLGVDYGELCIQTIQ